MSSEENCVRVVYTRFSAPLPANLEHAYLQAIPEAFQGRILAFRRWQDRQASLLGKMLLLRLLQTYDPVRFGREKLTNLQQSSMGKPFLPAGPEFSISHSGEMVVVALAPEGKIGIDIEQMVELNVENLRGFVPEIDRYDQGEEGMLSFFYRHWTQREAVAKASGMGLLGPIETLVLDGDKALYDGTTWSLQKIPLQQDGYVSHLAMNTAHYRFTLEEVDLIVLSLHNGLFPC